MIYETLTYLAIGFIMTNFIKIGAGNEATKFYFENYLPNAETTLKFAVVVLWLPALLYYITTRRG